MNENHVTQVTDANTVLLAGNSVPELAAKVGEKLGLPIADALVKRFSDGEVRVQIGPKVSLRGRKVFIIQSTFAPAENWVELFLLADAVRRAGADDIIWLAPYIGYGRQDRKMSGHDPISAAVMLGLAVESGIKQIIPMDLHCGQEQGFISVPCANLWGRKVVLRRIFELLEFDTENSERLRQQVTDQVVFVAPDPGSAHVVSHYVQKFGALSIVGMKTRLQPNVTENIALLDGNRARGKTCIILDDVCDTFGTMNAIISTLIEKEEAKQVFVGTTHPILSGQAYELIASSPVTKIVVTDTVPLRKQSPKIEVVSVAEELATAVRYVVLSGIVSGLAAQF
jgi:ribose-phosphate pyrophosphokinase